MNVLFLDHDGVICLENNFGSRFKKNKGPRGYTNLMDMPVNERFDNFDKKAIIVLNQIIEKTDCEIVVTSDWRSWASVEDMGEYYLEQGIIKRPLDYTPSINNVEVPKDFKWHPDFNLEQERFLEINDWIKKNKPDKWVAIDDLYLGLTSVSPSGVQKQNWGLTNFVWSPVLYEGIKQTNVKEKILTFFR